MSRNAAAAVSALVLAVAMAGCGGEDTGSATPAGHGSSTAGPPAPVPTPSGAPVLTITGAVANHNDGSAVAFDLLTLDAMATVTTDIYEPFVKKDVKFTGVPMIELLGRAGVTPAATTVQLHALDDYKVDLKISDMADPDILLATKADGARIPVGAGGPIRLVFPADSAVGKNKDIWIWSIDSITVA
jgi:DMSO/TMAO reductase YedYZ molybdopterin-dependent catalytic subunit